MAGKPARAANVQLSKLKPGLAAAMEAFDRTGLPVNITAANDEPLARFAPRQAFSGDLTAVVTMKADTFRKRRTRAVHAAFYGLTLLVRDREDKEYVVYPPETYKDDVSPVAFERQVKRAMFGQLTSAGDDLPRIHAAIEDLGKKIDALVESGASAARPAQRCPAADPTLTEAFAEIGRLKVRVATLEAALNALGPSSPSSRTPRGGV
jgi:hypothetical protein